MALQEDYFVRRRLYPNVDFYSGIIYEALGFPVGLFPVLFAVPRMSGWLAQWQEMLQDPEQKIARPKQLYWGTASGRSRLAEVRRPSKRRADTRFRSAVALRCRPEVGVPVPTRRGAVGLYAVSSPCRATMPVGDRTAGPLSRAVRRVGAPPLRVDERLLGDLGQRLADDAEALRHHLGLGAEADPQEAFQLEVVRGHHQQAPLDPQALDEVLGPIGWS